MTDLIWSFSPWVVFLLATRVTSLSGALAAGTTAAIVVLVRAVARHRVHLLDVASLVYFLAIATAALTLQPANLESWGRFAQAGSHAFLTTIVFASIAVGHPFTESYARDRVPEQYWPSRQFRAINTRISAIWGLAFLIGTVSLVAYGLTETLPFILRVAIPFGSLYFAYQYTDAHTTDTDTTAPAVNA
jgi:hypothetical protein